MTTSPEETPAERRRRDHELLVRYHRDRDLAAREELVLRFMPLARQLAARYRGAGENLEDLVQVACLGLLKAVDRYEPGRGSPFTKYAVPTMLGELKRHFRDKGWSVHVPRATQELVLKVSDAMGALPGKLGRSPTPRDIAIAIGAPVEPPRSTRRDRPTTRTAPGLWPTRWPRKSPATSWSSWARRCAEPCRRCPTATG